MKSKIAVVGHTNSGKTTLIRTLLRRPIGEIDDRANVTQLSDSQQFEDLHAILIDTPGFQNAAAYLSYLNIKKSYGEEAASLVKETISLDYEEEVANTIKLVDACIYVASLESVPDDSILSEISLVHLFCKNLIVILNKNREFANKEGKEEAERRKKLWIEGCENLNVKNIIDFDAHWASPQKTYHLFERLEVILPSDKRQGFQKGVKDFKQRQKLLRDKAIEYALECIHKCREKDIIKNIEYKSNESNEEYFERVKKNLKDICGIELNEFLQKACSLYALAGELPETDVEELNSLRSSTRFETSGHASAAVVAGILAGIFGLFGVISGLIAASLTVSAGASIGSAIGGGLGAFIGYAGVKNDNEKLRAIQAGYVAFMCLNFLWIFSCYGWGKGTKIPKDLVNTINERTKKALPGIDPINWDKSSSNEMKIWMIRFIDRISE